MKSKLFSIFFLSLLSGSGLQATVYAVGTLVKGNQKVYFISDVPEQASSTVPNVALLTEAHKLGKHAKLIVDRDFAVANGIDGENAFDVKICLNHDDVNIDVINHEMDQISQSRFQKSTINQKVVALNDVKNPEEGRKAFLELHDVLMQNLMIDAVEKCTKEHIFVCSTPVFIAAVWNELKKAGWSPVGDESVLTFEQAFVQQLPNSTSLIEAAAACAQPIDVSRWIAEMPHNQTFFTAQNMFVCAAGLTAIAALACVAVKNNFLGWLRKKAGKFLFGYACVTPNVSTKLGALFKAEQYLAG